MDPGQVIVAVAGMVTCLLITVGIAWGVVQSTRARNQGSASDPPLEGEVAALSERVEELHQQLLEAHERLDFAERLLSQGNQGRLEAGK